MSAFLNTPPPDQLSPGTPGGQEKFLLTDMGFLRWGRDDKNVENRQLGGLHNF